MPAAPLEGRVAVVTGAARRLGRALALALARAGADVGVHHHTSRDDAESVVQQIRESGRRGLAFAADLLDRDAVERGFTSVARELGAIDILVNNVGRVRWKRLDDLSTEDWRDGLDGTLLVTSNACAAALPGMRQHARGRIINILDASADLMRPIELAAPYKIGKTGVLLLTRSLAVAEAPHGVTVNCVSPGTLDDSEILPPLDQIPAGRYGTYDDVASAMLFLAGDAAGYVTGTNLKVSGGYLI